MYSIDFELYLLLTEYLMKIASGKQSIIIRAMVQDRKKSTITERFEQWMEDFVTHFDENGNPIDD